MAASKEIVLDNVRLSYVNVWEPVMNQNGQLKYGTSVLIEDSNKKDLDKVRKTIEFVMEEAIRTGAISRAKKPVIESPLRNGSAEYKVEKQPKDYDGMWFFNARSNDQPSIVDESVSPIMDRSQVYSGCWGRVAVSFYFTDNGGVPRVAVGLNHLMKTKDDDRLDGRSNVLDVFKKYLDSGDGAEFGQ